MGETLKMALRMQMDVGPTPSRIWLPSRAEPRANPKHQAETRPSWALSQAKLNPDSPANPQLSPELNPEPSSERAKPSIKLIPESPAGPQAEHEPGCAGSQIASRAEPSCDEPSLELSWATSQIEPRPVSRAEKRALSQA